MQNSTQQQSAIFWFRQDLRLSDNPGLTEALAWALAQGGTLLPVYIWAPDEEGDWPPGAATRVWLHHSLTALKQSLKAIGSDLIVLDARKLKPGTILQSLMHVAQECGAGGVFWNRRYEPAVIARDKEIKSRLKEIGLHVETSNGSLLIEPWQVQTKEGKPYQVFGPFWRACMAQLEICNELPLTAPKALPKAGKGKVQVQVQVASSIDDLELLPKIHWDKGIVEAWKAGEASALNQLDKFIKSGLGEYQNMRNRPDIEGVSRMSPHLHFGEISPRQIWYAVNKKTASQKEARAAAFSYLREVGWREFSHHLLYHFPATTTEPLRPEFRTFPWESNQEALQAWQKGMTGYPMVDAGMRELWHTGIMHNRVRMVVASFLVKDLRLHWLAGARWFWDTLVDADLAQNTMGWQWTAGCGADAAPYFRVFNPILQGEKFDPDGEYVRKWIPELARIKSKNIHCPWAAPLELAAAGITLGQDYPLPIVDHAEARQMALAAFQIIKERKQEQSLAKSRQEVNR